MRVRADIAALINAGLDDGQIARRVNCHRATVNRTRNLMRRALAGPAAMERLYAEALPTDEDFLVAVETALESRLLPSPGIGVLEDTRSAVVQALMPLVDQLRAERDRLATEVERQIDAKIGVAGEWGNALVDKTAAENTLARVREYVATSDDDGIRTRETVLRFLGGGAALTPAQRLQRTQVERLLGKVRRNGDEAERDRLAAVLREVLDQFADWPKGGSLWPDGGVVAKVSAEDWDRWYAAATASSQEGA